MTVEELVKIDSNFNSALFISKANNMIKKVYNAVTLQELPKVDHFISDEVYSRFFQEMEYASSNGCHLFYDEVNVDSVIRDIQMIDDTYVISVNATCKYLKYCLDVQGNFVSGSDKNRITVVHQVIFKKKKNNTDMTTNRCRGCGFTYNIQDNGICPSCGRVYDLEEIDYYIDQFI